MALKEGDIIVTKRLSILKSKYRNKIGEIIRCVAANEKGAMYEVKLHICDTSLILRDDEMEEF